MLGIYCRISKDGDEKRSIEVQQSKGIEFSKSIGAKYEVYIDRGISGGMKRNDRPELDRLLNDVESGLVDSIYVYNQDRAARDEITWFEISAIVLEYGVKFYESGVLVDLTESGTFTMRGIKAIFDADERRKTSKRFKDVLKRNAEQGRRFSFIQYGYTTEDDKKTLKVDEEEAEIVRRIFALSLQGIGTGKIAEMLNNDNVPTRYNQIEKNATYKVKNKYTGEVEVRQKKDVKWKGGTVRGIILNPIYKGERRWNNTTYSAPKILEEWYWEKVNDNLKNNSNNRGKAVQHSYLLKGLLRCGKCGANYYGRTRVAPEGKKPKDHYYMCSSKRKGEHNCGNRSISIEALDGIIWICLISQGRLQKLIYEYFNSSETTVHLKELELKIESLTFELEQLNQQRSNILKNLRKIDLNVEEMNEALSEIKEEIKLKNGEIKEIEIQFEELSNSRANIQQDLDLLTNLKDLNLEGKRELLRKFIKNIKINHDREYNCYFLTVEFNVIGMGNEVFVYRTGWEYAHTIGEIMPDGQHNYQLMVWGMMEQLLATKGEMDFGILQNASEIYSEKYG